MDVVKCPHCGKELPIEAKFCPYCMQRLDEPVAVQLPREKNKPNIKAILISAAAVVAVISLALSTVFYFRNKVGVNKPESNTVGKPYLILMKHRIPMSLIMMIQTLPTVLLTVRMRTPHHHRIIRTAALL